MKGLLSNAILTPVTLLVGSLLLLSSLALSLSLSTSVNAVSNYDTAFQEVEEVFLKRENYVGSTCAEQNISLNWTSYLSDDDTLYYDGAGNTNEEQIELWQSFQQAQATGSWAVTQDKVFSGSWSETQYGTTQYDQGITVIWQENDPTFEISVTSDGNLGGTYYNYMKASASGWRSARITFNNGNLGGGQSCEVMVTGTTETQTYAWEHRISYSGPHQYDISETKVWFVSNWTEGTIPQGYEGGFPATGYDPPVEKDIYRPDVKACVDFRKLTIIDKSEPLPGEFPYKIHFIITQGTFETQTYFFEGDVEALSTTEINLPNDEPFGLQAWYFDENGNILNDTEISDFREMNITFSASANGCQDTTDPDVVCDENDHCEVPQTGGYPDCTVHNFKIRFWDNAPEWSIPSPLTVGCAVGVMWSRIIDFFEFIADTSDDEMDWGPLTGLVEPSTHGLASVITAPIGLFENIANGSYACTTLDVPLPYLSRDLELPCMNNFYTSVGGAFFTMYQTIVFGATAYYVGVRLLEMVKGFKEPTDDKIEVTAL